MKRMDIPQMAHIVPIRSRLQFTTNALPTIVLHSSREHEVVLVVDKCPLEYELLRRKDVYPRSTQAEQAVVEKLVADDKAARQKVYRWLDSHGKLLAEHKIRVVEFMGDERHWTGGLRAAAAMNLGAKLSTADWIVGFGDEDLCFQPGWDAGLWQTVRGRDPNRYVGTSVLVVPGVRDPIPTPLTSGWIHDQRAIVCHALTFPVAPRHADPASARLSHASLQRFHEAAAMPGVHEEPCGVRRMCHWVPLLMHRRLFDRIGGYPTSDRAHSSYDLVLDDTLHDLGVTKRMPLDLMTFHFKHYLHLSSEIDALWGDADTLGPIRETV